jgi:hypothetical protein
VSISEGGTILEDGNISEVGNISEGGNSDEEGDVLCDRPWGWVRVSNRSSVGAVETAGKGAWAATPVEDAAPGELYSLRSLLCTSHYGFDDDSSANLCSDDDDLW